MRQHELAGGLEVAVIAEALGERSLILARQHGNAAYLVHVRVETADGSGKDEIVLAGNYCGRGGGHLDETSWGDLLISMCRDISSRVIRVLRPQSVPSLEGDTRTISYCFRSKRSGARLDLPEVAAGRYER